MLRKAFSRAGMTWTTGPFQKDEGGSSCHCSMRGVQNCVIPIESSAYAAGGLDFWWFGGGSAIQLVGDEMVWVPKLPGSLVRDSAEGASAWRSKIRGQDRLPDDQNAKLLVRMAGEKLFGCGGPPQTRCSRRREQ